MKDAHENEVLKLAKYIKILGTGTTNAQNHVFWYETPPQYLKRESFRIICKRKGL